MPRSTISSNGTCSELASTYEKDFMELEKREGSGHDVTKERMKLFMNYVNDLRSQNEELMQDLDDTTKTKDDLLSRDHQKGDQIHKLNSSLSMAETEISQLQEEVSELKSTLTQLDLDKDEVGSLKGENNHLKSTLLQLEKEIHRLNCSLTESENELEVTRQCNDQLSVEVASVNAKLTKAQRKVVDAKDQLTRYDSLFWFLPAVVVTCGGLLLYSTTDKPTELVGPAMKSMTY